jgi:hypothetical protein
MRQPQPSLASHLLSFLVNLKHGMFVWRGQYRANGGPRLMHVEATNACNLACPFCARTTVMKRKIGYLDPTLFKNVASQAAAARYRQVISLEDPMFATMFAPASIGSRDLDFGYREYFSHGDLHDLR